MATRTLFEPLRQHLSAKEHTILIGARQVGKTTLLHQLEAVLKQQGSRAFFLSLEDPQLLLALNQHPENLFRYVPRPAEGARMTVLLDEIQYLSNPSNFLKYHYDLHSPLLKIVATGSSAFYIDRAFQDSLAGRKRIFELYSLDFEEYLRFRGEQELCEAYLQIQESPEYLSMYQFQLKQYFEEYLIWGGYPAVVLANSPSEKLTILKELTDSFLKKDVLELGIQDEQKFWQLLQLLAGQSGALLNRHELATTLRTHDAAIEGYIEALQKAFHVALVRPFFSNLRKEITKMPKLYFHDVGLRNSLLQYFAPLAQRQDKGELLENYAFTRLRDKHGLDQIRYWRTADGNEVDFVVKDPLTGKGFACEVKWNDTAFKAGKYTKFTTAYPDYPLACRSAECVQPENWILKL